MMSKFPDELTCDMAETYGIFDIKRVPVQLLATLAVGLRDDSRVKRAASNTTCSDEIILLASIADSLRWIVWSKTEDGANNRNRPASIMSYYTKSTKQENESDFESFESPDEFWEWARSVTENN
jgi:hypothetical protein